MELLPAGTKKHPKGSTSLVLEFGRLRLAKQLLAPEICFLPLSSCAKVTGVACSLHLFLPQDFLAICVLFQSTSHAASNRSSPAAVTPTAFSGRQGMDYPGVWTSEAASETQAQEQAASTLLETRMYLIISKACPNRCSRNCYSCPDLCSCPRRMPAARLTGKHPRKERKRDGRPVTKMQHYQMG